MNPLSGLWSTGVIAVVIRAFKFVFAHSLNSVDPPEAHTKPRLEAPLLFLLRSPLMTFSFFLL